MNTDGETRISLLNLRTYLELRDAEAATPGPPEPPTFVAQWGTVDGKLPPPVTPTGPCGDGSGNARDLDAAEVRPA